MIARHMAVVVLLASAAALVGAIGGRLLLPQVRPEAAIHMVLHHDIGLDANQRHRVDKLEQLFATRKQVLERTLPADNARLAKAIEADDGYGPRVTAAIDQSHRDMGALQRETLLHMFRLRSVLTGDQARMFDAAAERALTSNGPDAVGTGRPDPR